MMQEPNDAHGAFRPRPSDDEAPSAPTSIAARAMAALRPEGASYLSGLNPEQRRAVEATEGPVLVLAGAGTGKTRVLTTRIAHLIATGKARPYDILSVTFTNKAAREMKHRIGGLIGPAGEGMPWLGTFHAIGTKILRRHAELVGLKSDFTILGTDDHLRLMKQVISDQNIDEKRWPARSLAHTIDGWKNRGLSPEQVPPGEAQSFAFGKGGQLYAAYQARLATLNAVDFGDLLLLCLKLWRENPDILANYQDRFRYILVDEYQDTNVAQYLWLRLLAQARKKRRLRRRRRPVDLRLARRRGRQHPALRARFSRRHRGAAGAQLPLDRPHPRRRLRAHRQERGPPRQDPADRGRGGRARHGHGLVGFRRGGASGRRIDRVAPAQGGTRSRRSRCWCGSRRRCARSRIGSFRLACPIASSAARASTSAPRSATRWPICASP
ncbi:protein of unknown function [Methylorubrum extorquens]|uniref:DNA 3'-5' helicase n=1 Tax=Methylorubrum extorquens TaxID=408 RepID=A0A2N9AZL6_METEX|nr:protein of unknown function [Methylorubrum extorquens]SOR32760.1 protein of unknown function [Methylorubrum extorquens]